MSHRLGLGRLTSMGRNTQRIALAAVVLLHLIISMAHGYAHTSAGIDLNGLSLVFVPVVILAGPLIGLAWMWVNPSAGARVIGITMAASLLFGLVNHFIIPGADRIDHVVPHSRALFESTAVMLVVSEAAGAVLGLVYGRSRTTGPTYA